MSTDNLCRECEIWAARCQHLARAYNATEKLRAMAESRRRSVSTFDGDKIVIYKRADLERERDEAIEALNALSPAAKEATDVK